MTMTTRVNVMSGDSKTDLGQGTLIGYADVYFYQGKHGELISRHDAEWKPGFWFRLWHLITCRPIMKSSMNPVIELDSGQTVYGCQVWWTLVREGAPVPATRQGEE
jgi:hypothetical protein